MDQLRSETAVPREPASGWALIRVICGVTGVNVRARMEYRADFATLVLFGIVFQVAALAFVGVVVAGSHGIRGWSLHQVLFIASLRLLAHGLWEPIFDNLTLVSYRIRDGWFDRMLVRPVNPLIQVLLMRFWVNGIGDLALGITLFAVAQSRLHIHWSALSVVFLVLVLMGSILLEAAIYLVIASLSFWIVRTDGVASWAEDSMTFANYPLTIFPSVARFALTFVVPIGFLSFFPSTVFLGRTGQAPFTPYFAYGAPAVGLALFVGAYRLWKLGILHHRSTGT
jgi:ABC-2 type transport system permease protein